MSSAVLRGLNGTYFVMIWKLASQLTALRFAFLGEKWVVDAITVFDSVLCRSISMVLIVRRGGSLHGSLQRGGQGERSVPWWFLKSTIHC